MKSADSQIANFVQKLVKLTDDDTLIWRRVSLVGNEHLCDYKHWDIYVEVKQDDMDYLSLIDLNCHEKGIEGYQYSIGDLHSAIKNQYKRLKKFEYSTQKKKVVRDAIRRDLEEQMRNKQDFLERAQEFLKDPDLN